MPSTGPSSFKKRNVQIKIVKAECTDENFDLYRKYTVACHDIDESDVKKGGFDRWLCAQGLEYTTQKASNGRELNMGVYHMLYILDGKIIAVGVCDITPQALSSVYFFYDPDYKKLSLGVISALNEIGYVKAM